MSRRYQKKYTRPTYRSCGKMVANDAAKALAIARGVKRLLNVEIKNFDVQQSIALAQTPLVVPLCNIIIGNETVNRDGSQCKMVGIDLNFLLTQNPSAVQTFVRIMLILDKQTNQVQYVPADLLEDASGGNNIVSPRNLDNLKRFTVLYDRSFTLDINGVKSHIVKKYIKKEVLLRYDASTGAIDDLTQSSISIMQMATESTNTPTLTHFSRLRFIDN